MHENIKKYTRKTVSGICPFCSVEFKCPKSELTKKRVFPRTCSLSCALKLANKIRGYGPEKLRPKRENTPNKKQFKAISNLFDVENELFSYFIGLIATDGSISKNSNIINLSSIDIELVNIFINFCKQNININYNKEPIIDNRNKTPVFKIDICCPELKSKLINLGITPVKSKTIGKINISDENFFHFLRGVIDGDGSWSIVKKTGQVVFCICSGSEKFLLFLKERLEKAGFKTVKIRWGKSAKVYFLSLSTKEYPKLIELLYTDANYFLNRKKDRALISYKYHTKKDFI